MLIVIFYLLSEKKKERKTFFIKGVPDKNFQSCSYVSSGVMENLRLHSSTLKELLGGLILRSDPLDISND